jgi:branched-chain amino acid transport system ATP-binding protein
MEINNLEKSFGGLSALLDFNFQIAEGELVGLMAQTARARLRF